MARVKVWNDNVHPHKEEFKGQSIEIPAKGYIEMDYEDAVDFKGAFTPMKIKADNTHCPTGFKMIRVEPPQEPLFKENHLVNHADGRVAANAQELAKMLEHFSHMRTTDKDAEASTAGEGSRIAALEAQLEELKALVKSNTSEKKKSGPKPGFKKEANG